MPSIMVKEYRTKSNNFFNLYIILTVILFVIVVQLFDMGFLLVLGVFIIFFIFRIAQMIQNSTGTEQLIDFHRHGITLPPNVNVIPYKDIKARLLFFDPRPNTKPFSPGMYYFPFGSKKVQALLLLTILDEEYLVAETQEQKLGVWNITEEFESKIQLIEEYFTIEREGSDDLQGGFDLARSLVKSESHKP